MNLLPILLIAVVAILPQESRKADEAFKDALARAKESKLKVFLTFGSPGGEWCPVFEAWRARPDVAPLLAREFVLLHVDTARTPGGRELHRKYPKARDQGVPWSVIHDGAGTELADSNGPEGNIGFPNTDPEIEAFLKILKKVCSTLKDD